MKHKREHKVLFQAYVGVQNNPNYILSLVWNTCPESNLLNRLTLWCVRLGNTQPAPIIAIYRKFFCFNFVCDI
jgi:hypothetical protein